MWGKVQHQQLWQVDCSIFHWSLLTTALLNWSMSTAAFFSQWHPLIVLFFNYTAPQTNPDSQPRSEPALELHSRVASSVGVTSPLQQPRHRKQFWRKADKKTKNKSMAKEFSLMFWMYFHLKLKHSKTLNLHVANWKQFSGYQLLILIARLCISQLLFV